MKLASICILLSTLSICNSANAQIAVQDGITLNPELIERGKGLAKGIAKKLGKKAAVEGSKKAAPVVISMATVKFFLQPKKTISTAVVVAAGAGAGFWWYSTTVPYAVKKLAKDPTDFEIYWDNLADDFDKKLDFAQKTWDLYYENIGEEQKKYENLLVLLGYERPSLVKDLTTVIINPKTKAEQDDLERTKEFIAAKTEVMALATQIDAQYEPLCRGQVGQQIREQLIKLTPKDFAQLPLLNMNNMTYDFFNVDSYDKLIPKYQFTERDHIPSYDALEGFFSVIPNIQKNKHGKSKKIRNYNLSHNATAINLPFSLHRNNRTTSQVYVDDKKNLRKATIYDFTTLLVLKKVDVNNVFNLKNIVYNESDLLKSFVIIYGRNAQLCLYY